MRAVCLCAICPSGTMVLRLHMCRFIISLRRMTDQRWHNHTVNQGNKAKKIVVVVEFEQNLKKEARQIRWVFMKQRG